MEGGRVPGLEMQFDPRPGAQYGQIRLLRDVAEPDAADLHSLSSDLFGMVPVWRAGVRFRRPVAPRSSTGPPGGTP
ncbi:hypothetical protein GCM10010211_29080 [Streptomyces albospinus]|uniref:Uncharacterized protein n=1 Tax=Streptomyces albospinus TaxID=285515 RepID=A0ABQ2UZW7_9ACTN|nr:hypothetical protein GCM10010211_29080 [Streptomyces albospinus]